MEASAKSKDKGVPTIPQLIGGEWRAAAETAEVRDPYRGTVVARAPRSSLDDLQRAVAAAVAAKPVMAAMPGYKRAELLRRVAALLQRARRPDRRGDVARDRQGDQGCARRGGRDRRTRSSCPPRRRSASRASMCRSTAAPWAPARSPSCCAFRSEWWPASRRSTRRSTWPATRSRRRSRPATSIVLKAPPQSPGVVHEIAKLFVDAGAPAGFRERALRRSRRPGAGARIRDVDFITFTGSSRVGAEIKAASGLRRVALELGGDGPTIVAADAIVEDSAPVCCAQCHAARRPELHLGAERLCAREPLRGVRRPPGAGGENAQDSAIRSIPRPTSAR